MPVPEPLGSVSVPVPVAAVGLEWGVGSHLTCQPLLLLLLPLILLRAQRKEGCLAVITKNWEVTACPLSFKTGATMATMALAHRRSAPAAAIVERAVNSAVEEEVAVQPRRSHKNFTTALPAAAVAVSSVEVLAAAVVVAALDDLHPRATCNCSTFSTFNNSSLFMG